MISGHFIERCRVGSTPGHCQNYQVTVVVHKISFRLDVDR